MTELFQKDWNAPSRVYYSYIILRSMEWIDFFRANGPDGEEVLATRLYSGSIQFRLRSSNAHFNQSSRKWRSLLSGCVVSRQNEWDPPGEYDQFQL